MCRMASQKEDERRELNVMVLQFAGKNILVVDGASHKGLDLLPTPIAHLPEHSIVRGRTFLGIN